MKKKLFVVLLLVFSLLLISGCKNKEESNNQNQVTPSESGKIVKRYMHDYFDVKKFDKNKFTKTIYDENGNAYNIDKMLTDMAVEDEILRYIPIGDKYYLSPNVSIEKQYYDKSSENPNAKSDNDLELIKTVLGDPSLIYERYKDESGSSTGDIGLIYDYDDYMILVKLTDYSHWDRNTYGYTSPYITAMVIETKATWFSDNNDVGAISYNWFNNHTAYGKTISK